MICGLGHMFDLFEERYFIDKLILFLDLLVYSRCNTVKYISALFPVFNPHTRYSALVSYYL